MPPHTGEAVAAVSAALLATAAFVLARSETTFWAGTWAGHLLGVLGIGLMLFAAFGYTRRKQAPGGGAVAMRTAMRHHVLAGLLGPYLVVLHSGFSFAGLAGALTLVMVLVVASGVVGRAVYTAVPRKVTTVDPVRSAMLDAELARLEMRNAELLRQGDPDPQERERIRREMVVVRHQEEVLRATWQAEGGAERWRSVLRFWWYLHVPMSAALWVLALVHVVAALWYATFSR